MTDSGRQALGDGNDNNTLKAQDRLEPASSAAILDQLKERALDFFSNASNETIGICLAGLGVTTYFVLGRVGLVLIGVVGGVALSTSWEGSQDKEDGGNARRLELNRRKEAGIEVARRLLELRASQKESFLEGDIADEPLGFSGFRPATAQALEDLTDAVTNDYVK